MNKKLFVLTILAIVSFGFAGCLNWYIDNSAPYVDDVLPASHEIYDIEIVEVSDNNTLNISIRAIEGGNPSINIAKIKNADGDTIWANQNLDIMITNNEVNQIQIQYDDVPSGVYTLSLTTEAGGVFVSPSFSI